MTSRPEGDLSIDQVRAHRDAMIDVGRRLPGSPLAATASQLHTAELAEPLTKAPIIVDTDLGGDADDALALVAAARHQPDLALVLTADETGPEQGYGQRARLARHLLDTVERRDVTVTAGATVGRTDYFCVADLIPATVPAMRGGRDAVLAAVADVAGKSEGLICWVGMAPLSNLAEVCDHLPEIASRLQVTQMGGAIDYRRPDRAEHNIRLDVDAARRVLAAVADGRLAKPRFVISDVTFTDQIAVHAAHPLHQRLAADTTQPWARLLAEHLDRWYSAHHTSTLQHDALTLSAALGLPFVRAATTRVAMDEIGRWTQDETGTALRLSRSADYPAFMAWLSEALDPATVPAAAAATAAASSSVRRPA
ncbi:MULTISPECIES: nucleoside hydrolase [unclassified Pseudonocardia]|uniref:nucleoside hydrolase n=1 Tax=unclassified Pseudonocardia TaxID=2619320 RepID=UPI0001FFDA5A|nr:nucleoside hydrolase [Pseudonocardia sp. Ae707_Ps1]OLM09089.1 hypothetical protein Ae707Ps1_6036 [Pseudonocardia sp. Ae707_Ps1]